MAVIPVPRSLSEIRLPKTPEVRLALATDVDLRQVAQPIEDENGLVSDILSNWRLVAKCDRAGEAARLHIVGDGQRRGRPVVTSRLVAIDPTARLARTKTGSLYSLREEWNWGEPPPEHVVAVYLAFKS